MKTAKDTSAVDKAAPNETASNGTFVASACFPRSKCRIVGRLDADGNLVELEAPRTCTRPRAYTPPRDRI